MEFVVIGDHEVNVSGFMHRIIAVRGNREHTLFSWVTNHRCER